MFDWLRPKRAAPPPPAERGSFFSTHAHERGSPLIKAADVVRTLMGNTPKVEATGAQDGASSSGATMNQAAIGVPELLAMWYASQGFIGHQMAAILSQNWLIDKACTVPASDAIRKGFNIVSTDGDDLNPQTLKIMRRLDRRMALTANLRQFVRMGRVFGIRIALFKVESTDAEYYEKPFNPDGITPGSYRGMVQVDPYWASPMLDQGAASASDSKHFYEPTWWMINGRKYHRSHLIIFRNGGELPDLLKASYIYGGVPLPQRIMERVYAAERTANEAPQLVQTKRTNVWLTDMEKFTAIGDEGESRLKDWVSYRDNYGIKLGDKEGDEFQQFDTSLGDLDSVIMTQYQIVAAAANMPATKLLGTSPKGFNATGSFEEASYHEELESIQTHDLLPLIERHHLLVMRAYIPKDQWVETTADWNPLDSQTAEELAKTNLTKAQTGAALVSSGALTSEDERQRIALDKTSGYANIDLSVAPALPDDEDEDAQGAQ